MKKPGIIVLKHVGIWLLFSAIYVLASEKITKIIFSGMDYEVDQWLLVLSAGLLIIFTVSIFAMIVGLIKASRRKKGN